MSILSPSRQHAGNPDDDLQAASRPSSNGSNPQPPAVRPPAPSGANPELSPARRFSRPNRRSLSTPADCSPSGSTPPDATTCRRLSFL
ncbi:hypothetical protein IEQ34_020567 [Dendrobium chrysotoxum]|uniref:Uncharacterized protein n=1 Tax=Dendrobium chrysotoxum TaxID=161865 RepID=A0AAV7G195_DENCH|nr:hypothetical protein IEQ34_020567 [Dendrobium chrysotoxum]